MKRFLTCNLLMMAGSIGGLIWAAAPLGPSEVMTPSGTPGRHVPSSDAFNVHSLKTAPQKAPVFGSFERPAKRQLSPLHSPAFLDELYTGAFQSYYQDYEFNPNGGEFLSYDVSVLIEDTEVTIYNLFNLEEGYPYDYSTQEDIKGTYDPDTRTVTIPTAREFDKATLAGYIYNYYPAVVLSGTVSADGTIETDRELVFTLSEDGRRLSTEQDFGVMMYTQEGSAQGFKCIYKGGVMLKVEEASEIVCFTNTLDMGRCYAGESTTLSLNVFNLSENDGTVSLESDSEVFSPTVQSLTIPSLSQGSIMVEYSPTTVGHQVGEVTLTSEGQTYNIHLQGDCIEAIDYSSLVVEGEISFSTGADYPFALCEFDGHPAARSTCAAVNQCESYLKLGFDVPEGHMGTLSWKGNSSSEISYAAIPYIEADNRIIGSYEGLINTDISGNYNFAPGHHEMKFVYSVGWASYFGDNDYMTVYDLAFTSALIEEHAASLKTEEVVMPNSLLHDGVAEKEGIIQLLNVGSQPLKVTGVENSTHFSVALTEYEATLLELLELPLLFKTEEAGQYNETVTLHTTAGDFEVNCQALVRDWPDFQSIVKNGEFTFTTDEQNPWLVADGKAYNSTSKVIDTELTYCSLTAAFEVPEGKLGKLSWKGRLSTAGMVDGVWTDYLMIQISSSLGTKFTVVPGEYDLDTSFFPYFDEPNMTDLLCGSGPCSVTFHYVQYGDAAYVAEDLVEIYDLNLDLLDHEGNSAVIDREVVRFNDIYTGKYTTTKVGLLNTGTEPLRVLNVDGDGVFEGWAEDYPVPYNQSINVTLTFQPVESGEQKGYVTIFTTAGDFEVECNGYAIPTDGMLLIEDFEDDGAGWRIYDRDGDGDGWNLAYNVYGGVTTGHVHSGEECIVSFSWDYISGTFTPDNWTFSPEFEVPATGAWLTWWSAGDDNNRPGDIYSVYVGEGTPEIGQNFDMDSYKCVYTETVISDEWTQHCVDLSEFAGKRVHVAFRHYDCSGCYMVKIDDVIVYDHNPEVGVTVLPVSEAKVVSRTLYTVDGMRLETMPDKGIIIVTEILSDGTSRTLKVVR